MEYRISQELDLMRKLEMLADAAKYDVACTSSGVDRKNTGSGTGNCMTAGICHSFSSDGRCISLLKILFTNECIFDWCSSIRKPATARWTRVFCLTDFSL